MMNHYRKPPILILMLLIMSGNLAVLSAQSTDSIMVGKPMLRSLILPGWGERTMGNAGRGNTFLAAEASLWIGFGLFKAISNRAHDEMILKAVSQAQINPADKSVSYYDDIGNYNSLADYNDQMLRDRNAYVLYPEGQGYDWQWSSVAQRQAFKDLKFKRNLYSQFTIYALGAITINHMISAIDVVWLNRSGINLRATPIVGSNSPGVALTLTF